MEPAARSGWARPGDRGPGGHLDQRTTGIAASAASPSPMMRMGIACKRPGRIPGACDYTYDHDNRLSKVVCRDAQGTRYKPSNTSTTRSADRCAKL